jgi:hypothetical protein
MAAFFLGGIARFRVGAYAIDIILLQLSRCHPVALKLSISPVQIL